MSPKQEPEQDNRGTDVYVPTVSGTHTFTASYRGPARGQIIGLPPAGDQPRPCATCDGSGVVFEPDAKLGWVEDTCPACHGMSAP